MRGASLATRACLTAICDGAGGEKPFLFACESGYVEPAAVSGLNVLWGEHKGEWGGVQKSGASCVRLKTDDLPHSSDSFDTDW